MNLDDAQHYATAGLFVEYLHACSLATGIAGDAEGLRSTAWGEPERQQNFDPGQPPPGKDDAAGYWGLDCLQLVERVCRHLGVPETKWPALKHLPQVRAGPASARAAAQAAGPGTACVSPALAQTRQ